MFLISGFVHDTDFLDRVPSPTPPAPPPKSNEFQVSPPAGFLWESREKPLPQIDASMASMYSRSFCHQTQINNYPDRPFLQSENHDDVSSTQQPLYGRPQRSNTTPSQPSSPGWDYDIPAFPLPRSMSNRRPAAYADMKPIGAPPVPNARSPYAPMDQGPMTARPDSVLPPPPLPKDEAAPLPEIFHKRGESVDSRSSYGTASIIHGDVGSKRSTMMSSRRPSFGSVYRDPNSLLDDRRSAMRSGPLETLTESPSHQEPMGWDNLGRSNEQEDAPYSGFDFEIPAEKNNREFVIRPGEGTEKLQAPQHGYSESGSKPFQQHSPYQGSHSPGLSVDMPHLSRNRSPSSTSLSSNGQHNKSRQPSGSSNYLQPGGHSYDEENRRKNSDASEGGNSVSNFARALGLEDGEHHSADSSTASSDFSPSESRSGTSLSSLPSEASLSRRKASEASRLGPVVEELNPLPTQDRMPDENNESDSPTALQPPKIQDPMQVPDSPTDPAISKGSLALICDTHSPRSMESADSPSDRSPVSPAKERPAGILAPPTPRIGRPKGRCRGCGEAIIGKSVSSADGRLTGRYHRECFACCYCRIPFQTADFYVIENRPYCAQHYHELNGSLCSTCNTGIEGQYLETNERQGRGPSDRRKFHTDCLTCRTCNVVLKGEYFEWNGLVYCERDARRAAASVPPPRFRRPTLTSSPLRPGFPPGPPGPMGRPPFPPPGPGRRPPPPMGPDGLMPPGPYPGPFGPPPSPGMRRFPERRTTRLMMI